jgi:hypothetical protein
MPEIRQRRSPRRALELAIRVFGTDFQGRDFVEDSTTLVVSRHGAKIQLTRKLIPEQEIQILCQGNNREGLFRVVSQVGEATSEFSFWGVECLKPDENIWEGALPRPRPKPEPRPGPQPDPKLGSRSGPQLDPKLGSKPSWKDNSALQVVLRCANCGMRELVDLNERQIQHMRKSKGLLRDCPACGATSLWKGIAVQGS